MACDTFLTMLALPVLYLLFGKGPSVEVASDQETIESITVEATDQLQAVGP